MRMTRSLSLLQPPRQPDGPQRFPSSAAGVSLPSPPPSPQNPPPDSHRGVAVMGLPYGVSRWDSGPSARWRSLAWNPRPLLHPDSLHWGPLAQEGVTALPSGTFGRLLMCLRGFRTHPAPESVPGTQCQQQSPWSSPCEHWNQKTIHIRIAWARHVPNSGNSFPHLQNGDRVTDHSGL